jgi:hypothetical protein
VSLCKLSFDCDDVHVQLRNLFEDFVQIVNSILMPSRPCASKSIAMPNDLDEEIEIAWEVLKPQLIIVTPICTTSYMMVGYEHLHRVLRVNVRL